MQKVSEQPHPSNPSHSQKASLKVLLWNLLPPGDEKEGGNHTGSGGAVQVGLQGSKRVLHEGTMGRRNGGRLGQEVGARARRGLMIRARTHRARRWGT